MAEERAIIWRFIGDPKSLGRATDKAQKDLGGLDRGARKATTSLGGIKRVAAGAGLALGGMEMARFAGDAVQLAISAEEAASKFGTVFADSLDDATMQMDAWAEKAGVARDRAQDLWGTVGNLLGTTGLGGDEVVEFADNIGDLAGDLASFNDANPEQVFQELTQAITTSNREALTKYGITVQESEVKQRALNLAIAAGRDEATKADRAFAAYQIALEQSGDAVGDLDRTSGSLANRQRRLNASWRDAQIELGKALLPAMEELIPLAEEGVEVFGDLAASLGPVIGAVADTVGVVTDSRDAWAGLFRTLEDDGNEATSRFSRVWSNLFTGAIPGTIATLGEVADHFGLVGDEAETAGTKVEDLIPLSAQIEAAMYRANRNIELSQNDLTRAIEGTIAAEQRWSESDARAQLARDYEILAAAIRGTGSRTGAEELIVRQGGSLPTRYGSGGTSDQIREDDRIGNGGVIP